MHTVFDRITYPCDLPLVALALLVGATGFLASQVLVDRAVSPGASRGWTWLLGATIALTFWSTHFIALLGDRARLSDRYSLSLAMLALLAGLLLIGAGVAIATRWRHHALGPMGGGALAGLGTLALYGIGSRARLSDAAGQIDPDAILLLVMLVPPLSLIAFAALFGRRRAGRGAISVATLSLLALFAHLLGSASSPAVQAAALQGPATSLAGEGVSRKLFSLLAALMALKVLLIGIVSLFVANRGVRRLFYQAHHDPLTGLANRRRFRDLVAWQLDRAVGSGTTPALLMLDLDNFKPVNDEHGHAAGDALVQGVARRIAQLSDGEATAARMGGDEFAVLLHHADRPAAALLATRLQEVVSAPISLTPDAAQVQVGASIGIAMYPDDGEDIETLLRSADTAMYRAKARGKGVGVFFEPSMHARLTRRRRIEVRLRQALRDRQLRLHFQPLVNCRGRDPVCMEALLRWNDAELGDVLPDRFVPVAESSGLIVPIGDFVLQRACHEAASWSRAVRVAVNLSVVQFARGDLVASVSRALERSGLPGHRLELEITESFLLADDPANHRTIAALRSLGVRIAMDDFGTGYSSLNYLHRFGFDKLKIDRSFVSAIDAGDRRAISILGAAISMGRNLNMRVVAEGVETAEQARLLTELHCDELQGFLIAAPMSADAAAAFLRARHARLDLAIG